MSLYKFKKNDLFTTSLKTHPSNKFFIYGSQVFYNSKPDSAGQNTRNDNNVPTGFISVHEINIDRPSGQLIYPFISKEGSLASFKTVTSEAYNSDYNYGDTISGTYPHSASITRRYYAADEARAQITALENTINHYSYWSQEFAFNNTARNLSSSVLNFIDIPSIFYGSSIKKGSVNLNFYVSGTLIGQLNDERRNGELIHVNPVGSNQSGSKAGIILYNEGIIILTGSWAFSSPLHSEDYGAGGGNENPAWVYWGYGCNDGTSPEAAQSSSFSLDFEGVNYIPTLTMMAHAKRNELNFSNNPTYIEFNQDTTPLTGSTFYKEPDDLKIKNIVSSSFTSHSASYENVTYISKIAVYDDHRRLIGLAKLSSPIKKQISKNYTIKLKIDI